MIRYRNPTAAAAAVVILGSSLTAPATAQLAKPVHAEIPIETLKSAYLKCERTAVSGNVAAGDIMLCSVIYEEVKRRACWALKGFEILVTGTLGCDRAKMPVRPRLQSREIPIEGAPHRTRVSG